MYCVLELCAACRYLHYACYTYTSLVIPTEFDEG